MTYRCPLGRFMPSLPDPEQVKRDGWRDEKILVVRLDDPRLDFVMRKMVEELGEWLYGKGKA